MSGRQSISFHCACKKTLGHFAGCVVPKIVQKLDDQIFRSIDAILRLRDRGNRSDDVRRFGKNIALIECVRYE